MIRTIKDLKTIIENLPDNMEVMGYSGGNGDLINITHWIVSEDTLTEEEIQQGYPDGVIPTLVFDIDD